MQQMDAPALVIEQMSDHICYTPLLRGWLVADWYQPLAQYDTRLPTIAALGHPVVAVTSRDTAGQLHR